MSQIYNKFLAAEKKAKKIGRAYVRYRKHTGVYLVKSWQHIIKTLNVQFIGPKPVSINVRPREIGSKVFEAIKVGNKIYMKINKDLKDKSIFHDKEKLEEFGKSLSKFSKIVSAFYKILGMVE
ncbi:MAG: hypothetical protein KAH32_02060 [Chlamydiia bacterium]|nr:hypothetical protein [Chlamydiia bacterium]